MIPTHALKNDRHRRVVVNKLTTLNDYDFAAPHRHDYFEFFIFEKGGGTHMIDFESFPIQDFSIHIVAAGKVHQVNRALDSNGYVLLFRPELFNDTLINDFLFNHSCFSVQERKPDYQFDASQQQQIIDLADKIWEDYSSENPLKLDFISHAMALLFIQCMRRQTIGTSVLSGANGKTYQEFRQLLYGKFRELKKVKEYASLLHVTEKHLNEIVKTQTGLSASAIIYNQIITEAKRLLNTGMSAKEVAFDLQFEDPAHFSKFFKNQTGMPPSEFQKVHV